MIKQIQLKNVVCHQDSTLNLHPGVNMLIGPSENGKSAIINSILKLIYNKPLGDKWRSWWAGTSEITIELEDCSVSLFQDKGPAKYRIQNQDGHVKEIMAHGTNEIENIFKFNRRINIRKQLEKQSPIFLLSESPGEVAKHFNQIAGIYDINVTLDKAKKEVRSITNEIQNTKDLIEEKEEELKSYNGVDELLTLVQNAIDFQKEKQTIEEGIQKINNLRIDLSQILSKLEGKRLELRIKAYVENALTLFKEKEKIQTNIDYLYNMLNDLEKIILKKEKNKRLLHLKPKVEDAAGYFKTLSNIKSEIGSIRVKKEKIQNILNSIKTIKMLSMKTKKRFKDNMPDICPLCNTLLKRK